MMRVGVLASGSGSNFQALVEGLRARAPVAEVVHLVGNVPGARVFNRAAALDVPATLVDHRTFGARAAFEAAVVSALRAHRVELVCLAGFMRLVGSTLLEAFPGRVLNVHPALLPSFPGLHAVRQALDAGVRITGCTVHLVDGGVDTGPIVAQAAVPVGADDEASLSAKIQQQEHRLYAAVVAAFASGDVTVRGQAVSLRRAIA